ncbi:MAG: zinc-binding alcohol dehydrogenase family protein [Betaproteobacteria bacterium]|nr:zinc-binding alcohol dehydrogenase family protein [Betaproteobacteria bacterium]
MKALRFHASGSLSELLLLDHPNPKPREGEALVRVAAAGLNSSDVSNVLGRHAYTTLPRTPGRDFSGVVVEGPVALAGRAVWGTGKEFGFSRDGSHAQFIAVPVDGVALKPESLSFAQAAACGVPLITAWTALERTGVGQGCRLLVIGAAGGVGSAAVTLARWLGAVVTGAVRQRKQAGALEAVGVRTMLLSQDEPMAASAIAPPGFNVVFDTTGGLLAEAVALLAPFGRVAIIMAHGDGKVNVPVRNLYRRAGSIVGVNSLLYSAAECAKILSRLGPAFESGQLTPPTRIEERPLSQALETYRELNRGARGKFVFLP